MENRTEPATPCRREEARKLGIVARSATLSGAVVLIVGAIALQTTSPVTGLGELVRARLAALGDATEESLVPSIGEALISAAWMLMPVALALLAAAILANLAQVGFQFVRPRRGAPERSPWRPAMGLLAAALLAAVAILSIRPADSWPTFASMAFCVALRGGLVLLAIGIVDYLVQRRRVERMLMMTRDEVLREQREDGRRP